MTKSPFCQVLELGTTAGELAVLVQADYDGLISLQGNDFSVQTTQPRGVALLEK